MAMPKSWVDEQARYWVNEVAINWNAALVYAFSPLVGGTPIAGIADAGPGTTIVDDGGRGLSLEAGGGGAGTGGDSGDASSAGDATASGADGGTSTGSPGGAQPGSMSRGCGCRVVGVTPESQSGRDAPWGGAGWIGALGAILLRGARRGRQGGRQRRVA
jgi:hypothetical protein